MSDLREFEPLSTLSEEMSSQGDLLLRDTLQSLYPDEVAVPPPDGWDALDSAARGYAARRRRRALARKLLAALGPKRIVAYAAGLLLLPAAGIVIAHHHAKTPPPTPPKLAEARAQLRGSGAVPKPVSLLNGAVIEVMGDVSVEQSDVAGSHVRLAAGAVRATVPHLPTGQSFVVSTPSADVIVHGTRFTVQQTDAGRTNVTVDAGLVEVRPTDGHRPSFLLHPGETAGVDPFEVYFNGLAATVAHAVAAEQCGDVETSVRRYIDAAPTSVDVTAAHYLLGVCAFQRGEHGTSLDAFEKAAESTSPARADNALARIAQLRARESQTAGAAAWSRYLARFPQGLHTQLAREFLDRHRGSEQAP